VIKLLSTEKGNTPETTSIGERNFGIGLMLVIAYAANIGGVATIIGTPPNVVFVGLLDQFYQQKMHFGKWMLIGVPLSLLLLTCCYFVITRFIFPNHLKKIHGADTLIKKEVRRIGFHPQRRKVGTNDFYPHLLTLDFSTSHSICS
jgi:sodium-dependent dicarboxylate transporter 2/3/5